MYRMNNGSINNEQWRDSANYVESHAQLVYLLLFNSGLCQKEVFNYYSQRTDLIKKPFPKNRRYVDTKNIKELAYQPAQDPGRLSISYVIKSLDERGIDTLPVDCSDELKSISAIIDTFSNELEKSSKNVLLKDL